MNTEATKLLRPEFEPVFTDAQVERMEAAHNKTFGVGRRILMVTLARSGAQLVEMIEGMIAGGDDEAIFEMIDQITQYQTHVTDAAELAEAALARLLWAAQYASKGAEA